jgi:Rps23 Pro-64 3,4-dihydroxylase Tpa1-like proline 4-hydroxylase
VRHAPKRVFESPEAVVFDDFLPEEVYERVRAFCLEADYEYINTRGAVSRAWHVHDGFPLRSTLNEFYYAEGLEKPEGSHVYPTGSGMDAFLEALLRVQPEVEHLTGRLGRDWGHVSATAWMYPPGTGLSMHDDGSGVYTGAYVYFLNPEWRLHWGGLLLLVEGEGNQRVYAHRKSTDEIEFYRRKWLHANEMDELLMEHGFARCVFPKRNRIVFIANNAYHMVTRVNETAGDNLRMSIAGFFNRTK